MLDGARTHGIALVIVVLISLFAGVWLSRALRRRASRSRNRVALRGEAEAEYILEDLGYRIIERQARANFYIRVDGRNVEVEVRADLLVEKRGRRFVAEVKTGAVAPNPVFPSTRRQLLEYA